MELVDDDSGIIYLRARVYHFTLFSCCLKVDVADGITYGKHDDEMAVFVANTSNKVLLFVTLPLKYSAVAETRYAINYTAGLTAGFAGFEGGVEGGRGFEKEERNEYVSYPKSEVPSEQLVKPQAKNQRIGIREKGCAQRLLICSVEDVPSSSLATPVSQSSASQRAPASDALISREQDGFQIVRYYHENQTVSGGVSLAVHQTRVDIGLSKFCRVRKNKVVLAHVAMALAGLSESAEDTASGTNPSQATPKATRRWVSSLFGSR